MTWLLPSINRLERLCIGLLWDFLFFRLGKSGRLSVLLVGKVPERTNRNYECGF